MKSTGILAFSILMLVLGQIFTSCEKNEPTPQFSELTIELDYKELDGFKGQFSQIGIFVRDKGGAFIYNSADKIENNLWSVRLLPGTYTVSAEYIEASSQAENIVLDSTTIEVKTGNKQKLTLVVNLHLIN